MQAQYRSSRPQGSAFTLTFVDIARCLAHLPVPILPTPHAQRALSRRRLITGLMAAGGLGLGACSAPHPILRLGSIVFPGYELIFLARELGLLDDQQVRLIEMPSSTSTLRALAVGQLEAANLTLDEFISARADGMDLRVLAVLDVSAGADAVFSRGPMELSALAGKRVAVEDGAVGGIVLAALLEAARLHPQQIRKQTTTQANTAADFIQGRADVVVTAEPWVSQIEAAGGHRLFDSTRMPGRIVDVLVAHQSAITHQPEALQGLLQAHFAGLAHLRAQPEDASRRMAARLQLAPTAVPAVFRGLELPDRSQNLALLRDGGQIDQTVRLLQQDMLRAGLMRSTRPLSEISDTGPLQAVPAG